MSVTERREAVDEDVLRRFTVEHQAVRGRFVRLGSAWLALREHADYPEPVRRLLGEATAAAALLASTIKFEGELTLQMQGTGAVRLLVAQCTHDLKLRAVARFDAQRVAEGFEALVGDGQLAVTLEAEGGARYQGIVPLGGGSLAAALERYFEGSEQLPTAIALAADDSQAAGMLVQRMPQSGGRAAADDSASLAAREAEASATLEATREAHPETIVVEMGWPDAERRYADIVTWGASRLMGSVLLDWLDARASKGQAS